MSPRGQTAFEFLFLVAVAFLILIVFSASTRDEFLDAQSAKEYALVKDLAFSLQGEVNRASTLEDGYRRTFKLENTLEGYAYNTSIRNSTLIVQSRDYEFALTVYPVTGNFTNGTNTIRKTNGVVYLNQ
ncbi:MAG TPA: hypothetical protein VLJ21_03015 [Candidatus Binatia bacterium]|nr:hypothetical protein [Candidatus Binatia bacterium]